ncbi:hypothetical protein BBOV_III007512 [Babesia bovis T2Bo]|uniref:hypothetical protein n=1 Tax=Babesia bovis T2Bo TaxID=484906 RepID=UPI001C36C103|nr:hypothetical protein BBOV_III007512 [Babesia bovis T2Bo]KAG6439996.1 hypothetical protein BBOV_III007512 [Babesia bovis T2Bo]
MNITSQLSHYICKACKRSITHKLAVNLIAERIYQPSVEKHNAHDNGNNKDSGNPSETHIEEKHRATLQQQLYGPVTPWMIKQSDIPLHNNFAKMATMLNRGRCPCPYCNSKGTWVNGKEAGCR